MKYVIIGIIVSVFLSGCKQKKQENILFQAEKLMEVQCDSALSLLRSIDKLSLNEEIIARYALLYTEALYRNHLPMVSDSLIKLALAYYQQEPESVHVAKLYFYQGYYYAAQCKEGEAIESLIKAEKIALNKNYFDLLGFIYRKLGKMEIEQFRKEQALKMFDKSVYYFRKTKRKKEEGNVLTNKGKVFLFLNQYDSAFYYLDAGKKLAIENKDTIGFSAALSLEGYAYVNQGKYRKSRELIRKALPFSTDRILIACFVALSDGYFFENQLDSAEYYLFKAFENCKVGGKKTILCQRLSRIAEKKGNYKEAFLQLSKIWAYRDSLYSNFVKNSVYELTLKHRYEMACKDTNLLNIKTMKLESFLILCIFILIIIFFFYQYNNEKKERETLKNKLLIEKLQYNELKLKEAFSLGIGEKESKLKLFFERRIDRMKDLIELSYKNGNDPEKFREDFQKIISVQSFTFEDWQCLEEGINITCNGLMAYLRHTYLELTEEDIHYCCMVCAHFDTQEIAILLNIDKLSVYKRRNRIRPKMNIQKNCSIENFFQDLIYQLK